MQGVERHWHNPVRTRVTPLDSSDALYIVFLAYTVKPMDNVVFFRHPCVRPMRFTHAPIINLTFAFYPRTFCQFNLTHLLLVQPVRFTLAPIASLTCAFYARTYYWFSLCVFDARTHH
jgi:hypothetical protein